MRIGYILHPYGEKHPSGLARYAVELLRALLEIDKENEYLIFTKGERSLPELPRKNFQYIPLKSGIFWREQGLPNMPRADVYIFPGQMAPLWGSFGKTIAVAHDFPYHYVTPDSLKQRIYAPLLHALHKRAYNHADKVVAISEYTKNELVNLFGVSKDKIIVIYNGFKDICEIPPREVGAPKPYFLTVGAVKERKNTFGLVKAFALLKKEHKLPHKLVIAGKTGNTYSGRTLAFIKENCLEGEVIFPGHMDDHQISYLYQNAEALVFPSIIESFGFPVLEAFACGTPVITSNEGGVAEVAGSAALLVNPRSEQEIARAMHNVATNDRVRSRLVARGNDRAKQFSWQKTATDLLKLLNDL